MLQKPDLSKIEELFNVRFFKVPSYQREYVWENDDIDKFLEDVKSAKEDAQPYYFIGNLVLYKPPTADKTYEIVDGQQRLTTIFLILAAAKQLAKEAARESDEEALNDLLFKREQIGPSSYRNNYRVEPLYPPSKAILQAVARDETPDSSLLHDAAGLRTFKAFLRIRAYLSKLSDSQLSDYWFYLIDKVTVLTMTTDSRAEANTIFGRINSRGQTLDPPDLVKSLVLQKVADDQYSELSNTWKEISNVLDAQRESYTRFLRYYIITSHAEKIRENDILNWFTHKDRRELFARPEKFLSDLQEHAVRHSKLLEGKVNEEEIESLLAIRQLSRRARQHLLALLPLFRLPKAEQVRAISTIGVLAETAVFSAMITDENTTTNENRFISWSIDLQKKTSVSEVKAYAREHIEPDVRGKREEVHLKLRSFTESEPSKDVRRYVLAKLWAYVEGHYQEAGTDFRRLGHYSSRNFSEEHILSQSPSNAALEEFGDPDAENLFRYSLGNLMLLEYDINKSIGNGPFSEKVPKYRRSNMMLNRALGGSFMDYEASLTTRGKKIWHRLEHFESWTPVDLNRRLVNLIELADSVWSFQ